MSTHVERRRVLKALGAAALANLTASELFATGRAIQSRSSESPDRYEVLDPAERELVAAVAEIILPETETPGATSARVDLFIDRLLAEWFTEAEKTRFLEGVSRLAQAGFGAMAEKDRILHLEALELAPVGEEPSGSPADAPFIAVMKWLTVYGYFTSEAGMEQGGDFIAFHGTYDGCAPLRK